MQINWRILVLFSFFALIVLLAVSGVFQQLYIALLLQTQGWQRLFHEEVVSRLRLIKETHSMTATWGLILIGFLYGILHAVGPGHGKIVVSSYLLASKASLKRGFVVTFSAALMQACVALLLVFGLTTVLGLTRDVAQETTASLTNVSFGLILLIGAVLLWRGGKEALLCFKKKQSSECACADNHHTPSAKEVDKANSWQALITLIISIGLRPCSGALLLLLFADLVGVYTAGVMATFAMALGTAITTSALAALTVFSKSIALRFVSSSSGDTLRLTLASFSVMGGMLIILLGTAFLQGNIMGSSFSALGSNMVTTKTHPLMKNFSQTR